MASLHAREALVKIPPWLWGNDPSKYFQGAEIRIRAVRGSQATHALRTFESYYRNRPALINSITLTESEGRDVRLQQLPDLLPRDFAPDSTDEFIRRGVDELAGLPGLANNLGHLQLRTMAATLSELEEVVREGILEIRAMPQASNSNLHPFSSARAFAITRRGALLQRTKLAAVLLRVSYDDRLAQGDHAHLLDELNQGRSVFASAEGLHDGVVLMDAYVGPLLGALTPAVWAFAAPRAGGLIVYSLGRPVHGRTSSRSGVLQLLLARGDSEPFALPTVLPADDEAAIHWWASRLNDVFAILSDPSNFINASNTYDPGEHLRTILTFEQLFRRVSSIQTVENDINARNVLLFTVLDTVERLTGRPIERLCSLRFVEQRVRNLRSTIPDAAARILLFGVDRAARALEDLGAGFFLVEQDGTVDVGEGPDGQVRYLDLDAACAQYIKILRNATHGHGSKRANTVALTNSLLARHNGHVPHNLALLGYVYLLEIMANPDHLKDSLRRHRR